jgi:hypothetical protein
MEMAAAVKFRVTLSPRNLLGPLTRQHRTTHPILGLRTWREMAEAANQIRRATGVRICTWCHSAVPGARRTRCGSAQCAEFIWRAYSWERCRREALRINRRCRCGKRASEVDHLVPVSLGGSGDLWNLRSLCRRCHLEATQRLRRDKTLYIAR